MIIALSRIGITLFISFSRSAAIAASHRERGKMVINGRTNSHLDVFNMMKNIKYFLHTHPRLKIKPPART
jgi:hypothetical protein